MYTQYVTEYHQLPLNVQIKCKLTATTETYIFMLIVKLSYLSIAFTYDTQVLWHCSVYYSKVLLCNIDNNHSSCSYRFQHYILITTL